MVITVEGEIPLGDTQSIVHTGSRRPVRERQLRQIQWLECFYDRETGDVPVLIARIFLTG